VKGSMADDSKSKLRDEIREVRQNYDRLPRGLTAAIRRCRSDDDVALEGTYWRIGGKLAHRQNQLAGVVLLFPLARHATNDRFSFGHYLRRHVGDGAGALLRVRRLLDSRDRPEFLHRLRATLRLAARAGAPVDWGALGEDICWFFSESDRVRRRWAQDFYAPQISETTPRDVPTTTT
jgi:CRISPR type I-E-associated protein CasB/Cse2